ncbi:hypothetical protein JW998_01385 [candidate division KSB1 bacterium]|nr:hypothetical protein [candidate division KSB1 bacterium]
MNPMKLIFSLYFILWIAAPGWAQSAVVKMDPASVSTDVGETFVVNVAIENASNLRGISVKIDFNPAILQVQKINSGGFMSGFGQTFSFSNKNNTEGWVQYDESILGSGDMAEGAGVVCNIEVKAITNGVSSLTIITADLRDRDNMPITSEVKNATVMVGGSAVLAKVKVMLEGPYNVNASAMITRLQEQELIPLASPYAQAPQTVTFIPEGIVDWILIELRTSAAGLTVAQKSCFLQNNGHVVEPQNQSEILTFFDLDAGDYYIVLRHRNHLAAMSATAVPLNSSTPPLYEFDMKSKYYGDDAKQLNDAGTLFGMYAGDGDASGEVTATDKNNVLSHRDQTDYLSSDYNLSGFVTISDIDFAAANTNVSTHVPAN